MSTARPNRRKLVFGVGINDYPDSVYVNGKKIPAYVAWHGMLERCYNEKFHARYPTYIGCSVCDDWVYFTRFKAWYDVNYKEGYHIDKDILVQGNKVYSPSTCNYVPGYINRLIVEQKEGEHSTGVGYNIRCKSRPYQAHCRIYGKVKPFGYFATALEAHQVYVEVKTKHIEDIAHQAYTSGEINHQVYIALLNWEVI